jgi:hypothetical protein
MVHTIIDLLKYNETTKLLPSTRTIKVIGTILFISIDNNHFIISAK